MHRHRVVVTGIGAITPIGNSVESYWDALLQGKNGAAEITLFDTSQFKTRFACEVKDFKAEEHISRRDLRRMDRFSQFAIVASREGIKDAFGDLSKIDKDEVGVVWASGIGGLYSLEHSISEYARGDGTPRFNPFFIPKMIIDISSGWISMEHGLRGPNFGVVSACASSSHALISAMSFIRSGQARVIVTGGSESGVTISSVGGFNALKALSERNEDYETASRPFDKHRDGFVLGEGGACIVLEQYETRQGPWCKNICRTCRRRYVGGCIPPYGTPPRRHRRVPLYVSRTGRCQYSARRNWATLTHTPLLLHWVM